MVSATGEQNVDEADDGHNAAQASESHVPVAQSPDANAGFACPHCDKVFTTLTNLSKHKNQMHSDRYFQCDYCEYGTCVKYNMEQHVFHMHTEEGQAKRFRCDQCGKCFHRKAYMHRHVNEVHKAANVRHECHVCGKQYKRAKHLRDHVKVAHCAQSQMPGTSTLVTNGTRNTGNSDDDVDGSDLCDNWFHCGECAKRFGDRRLLAQHVALRHKLKCGQCGYRTTAKRKLQEHMSRAHCADSAGKALHCSQCGRRFSRLAYLQNHMQEVHRIGNVRFQCTLCDVKYRRRKELREHVKQVHGHGEKASNEQGTEYAVTNVSPMDEHCAERGPDDVKLPSTSTVNNNKAATAAVTCCYCGKGYKDTISLSKHVWKMHDPNRYYQCDYCAYGTAVKYNMEKHVFHMHTDEGQQKKFKCEHCCKMFHRKSYRDAHVRECHETPDDKFKCAMCPVSYRRKCHLRAHVLLKHADGGGGARGSQPRAQPQQRGQRQSEQPAALRITKYTAHAKNVMLVHCEHCDYQTDTEQFLHRHMLRAHGVSVADAPRPTAGCTDDGVTCDRDSAVTMVVVDRQLTATATAAAASGVHDA